MEVANWDGANIHRTSLQARAAQRGLDPLREGAAARADARGPGDRHPADGRAVRRPGRCPGTIDIGGPGPPLQTIRLRDARRDAACSAIEIPRERSAEILDGARVQPRRRAATASTSPCPPFRRADVTREADLIEEIARLGALEHAAGDAAVAATAPPAGSPPASGCAAAPPTRSTAQGLHEIVGWSFDGPGAGRAAADRRPPGGRAREPDVGRPVAAAHHAARLAARRRAGATAARGAAAVAAVRGRRGLPPARGRARCRDEPHHVAALLLGPVRPADLARRRPAARADFFAAKGVLGGLLDTVARAVDAEAGRRRRAVPASRARGRGSCVDGAPAGWIGEIHPQVAGRLGLVGPGRRLRARPRRRRRPGRTSPAIADLTSFPEVREDLAVIVADTVTAAEVLAVVRRGRRRRCSPAPRCSTSTATQQRIGAGQRVAGAAAALPRRRPHADRRGGGHPAAQDRRRAGRRSWRGGSVTPDPTVAVFGAAGYAGALSRPAAAPPPVRSS